MSTSQTPKERRIVAHPVAFSIMRMCGVDPAVAVAGKASWPDGYAPDYVEDDRGNLRLRMPLDTKREVMLTVDGEKARISARYQTLPDSVMVAVPGLPLSQLVDHVLFTGAGIPVLAAERFDEAEDGVGTHFELGGEAVSITVQ